MKRVEFARWLIALLLLSLIGGTAYTAQAQSTGIAVIIARPGEGETIYAGPQTILYSIAVTGRVVVASGDRRGISVKLEIFDGTTQIGTRTAQTSADGTFSIPVTVNPDKSANELLSGSTLDRNGSCLTACHYGIDLSLKAGHLLLRVTATDAGGRRATDQRHITVDRGGYATIPVQVELESPTQSLQDIPITIGTRVYMVRARYATSATDASGHANVTVEALAEAPTHYVIQVAPTVVNGLLVQSLKPVEVDLQPGATSAPTATLRITARSGQITGHLAPTIAPSAPLTVRAIRVRDGVSYQATTTAQGQFTFPELPIDQYLVALDKTALAQQNLGSRDVRMDLAQNISATADVPLAALEGASQAGTVRDTQGTALPFAWLSMANTGINSNVLPESGGFFMTGLPPKAVSMIAVAPGYYSQAQALDLSLSSKPTQPLDLVLARRPETRSLPWGNGEVVIPPESDVNVTNVTSGQIIFTQGWLWGHSDESQRLDIQVGGLTIGIVRGKFAVEQLPGQTGWFYLLDGEATVTQGSTLVAVKAGQMVALKQKTRPLAVPIDPVVITALHPAAPAPFSPAWEPTLGARIRDGLAQMGIGVVQVVTFATYLLDVLLVCLIPLAGFIWWLKKRTRTRDI